LWVLGLGAGFRALVNYELKAGTSATAPLAWVAGTPLPFDASVPNLVMFAHPQCPCSRASMDELAFLMTRCQGKVRATVCFSAPDGEPAAWTQSALWRSAAAIPGVTIMADHNGAIAQQYGSATSGQALVFDPAGKRIFSGGITGARGHEGDNRGLDFVIALARGELCSATDTPVFGCSLVDPPAPAPGTRP
jgi:hypothetical protein